MNKIALRLPALLSGFFRSARLWLAASAGPAAESCSALAVHGRVQVACGPARPAPVRDHPTTPFSPAA